MTRHLRMAAVLGTFLLLSLSAVLAGAAPAGAAPGSSVTMSPSNPATGPFDHETVPISGSYTDSSGATGTVDILECMASAVPPVGQPLDRTQCDHTNIDSGVNPDPSSHTHNSYFVFDLNFTTTSGTPVDCSVSGACMLVMDANPPGDVEAANPLLGVLSCEGAFSPAATSTFVKTTTPVGGNSTQSLGTLPIVTPGQTINVKLTWNSGDFLAGLQLSDDADCVSINGSDRTDLAVELGLGDAPPYTTSYTVPADTPAGSKVCDRGRISGVPAHLFRPATEYSNIVCFQVGPAVATPELRWPVALGLAGVGLIGGVVVVRRRPRTST